MHRARSCPTMSIRSLGLPAAGEGTSPLPTMTSTWRTSPAQQNLSRTFNSETFRFNVSGEWGVLASAAPS